MEFDPGDQRHPHRVGHSRGRERSGTRFVISPGNSPGKQDHFDADAHFCDAHAEAADTNAGSADTNAGSTDTYACSADTYSGATDTYACSAHANAGSTYAEAAYAGSADACAEAESDAERVADSNSNWHADADAGHRWIMGWDDSEMVLAARGSQSFDEWFVREWARVLERGAEQRHLDAGMHEC